MISILAELQTLLKPYNAYLDDVPLHFDWSNNPVGVYIVMNTATEDEGSYEYDLQIYVEADIKDKLSQLRVLNDISKLLKRKRMESGWIVPKNVHINHFQESSKSSYILEFWVKVYDSE